MVVLGADSESVELHLLVLFDEHVHLEGLQLGVELLDDFKQGNLPFFNFSQPLLVLVIFFFLPAIMICVQIFGKSL